MLDPRRHVLGLALAALALSVLPTGAADHIPAYEDRPCITTDGPHVDADCHVGGRYRYTIPGTSSLPPFAVEAGVDTADALPGAVPFTLPGGDPATTVATTEWTDPALDAASGAEVAWKRAALDSVESTGFHARLLCGWDLPETAFVCAIHDPESESLWAPVRGERDRLVAEGLAAWFDSGFARAKTLAPSADVRVGTSPLTVRVENETAALDTAPQGRAGSGDVAVALPDQPLPPPLSAVSGASGEAPALPSLVAIESTNGTTTPVARGAEPGTSVVQGTAAPGGTRAPAAEVLAAAALGGLALIAAGLALAHRHVSRANVLDNAVRARILEAIRSAPGATIQELARASGVSHTTATYHLALLENVGLAVSESIGNRKH